MSLTFFCEKQDVSISELIEVDGTLKVNASKTTQSEHDNPYNLNGLHA